MAESQVNREQEQALARLRCAHCQSLIDCEALAGAVLNELRRRYHMDRLNDGADVKDAELLEAVREGIGCFLHNNSASNDDSNESAA